MKQTVEEAAREYASSEIGSGGLKGVCGIEADKYDSFFAGAKWREAQMVKHISTVQDCELAVRETKQKAIEAFRQFVEQYCTESGRSDISNESEHYISVFESLINKEVP